MDSNEYLINNFYKLSMSESQEINGGSVLLGIAAGIATGVVGYCVYEGADQIVENSTGKDIPDHFNDWVDSF